MSASSYARAKKLVVAKAEELAEKVHWGQEKEFLVPLIFRDFIAEMKMFGAAPSLHTTGMARFKEQLKALRLRMVN